MASEPPRLPPGTGAFRPDPAQRDEPKDHMAGWNIAVRNALENIGRAPGNYDVKVVLSAAICVENPGYVIEYIATLV